MLRKTLSIGALALLLAIAPEASAKNFFQKAQEKLEKVSQALDGVSSSYSGLSGYDFNITKAYRDGNGVTVEYTMINNSGSDIPIAISRSTEKNAPSQAIGSDGTVFTVKPGKLGGKVSTAHNTYPAGVLLKGTLTIEDVPTSVTKFKSLVLGGNQYNAKAKSSKDRYTYFQYAYSNYPIQELDNTSGSNVSCNCPDLAVAYKGISRNGNTITLTMTITSINGDSDVGSYGATVYDNEGNTIERVGQTLGGQQWGAYSGKLPENVPVKAVFTFDVNKAATKIALFKLSLNPSPYVIEIKNINLPAAQ